MLSGLGDQIDPRRVALAAWASTVWHTSGLNLNLLWAGGSYLSLFLDKPIA